LLTVYLIVPDETIIAGAEQLVIERIQARVPDAAIMRSYDAAGKAGLEIVEKDPALGREGEQIVVVPAQALAHLVGILLDLQHHRPVSHASDSEARVSARYSEQTQSLVEGQAPDGAG